MPSSIVPPSRKTAEVDALDVRSNPFLAILRVMSPLSLSHDLSNTDFFSRPLSEPWTDCLDSRPGCPRNVIRGMAFAALQSTSVYRVSKKADLLRSRTLVPDRGSS